MLSLLSVDTLLALGAACGPGAVDALGAHPFMLAALNGDRALVRKMVSAVGGAAYVNQRVVPPHLLPFALAFFIGRMRRRVLGPRRVGLKQVTIGGSTALHGAVMVSNLTTLKAFLDEGADPYVRNKFGMTPLLLLRALGGCPHMEQVLLHRMSNSTRQTYKHKQHTQQQPARQSRQQSRGWCRALTSKVVADDDTGPGV